MKRVIVSGLAIGLVALGVGACGSDDDSSQQLQGCPSVCQCVVASGGDPSTCDSECDAVVKAGGNVKSGCEQRLELWGYAQCKPRCATFPSS